MIMKGKPHRILSGKLPGSQKFTPVFGVATVMLLLIVMWSPTVQAAETRTVNGWIRIDPDLVNMTVNYTWNASDPSNSYLYNWNQTVDPFEQNNSLNGSFTGTFLPPIEFQVTQYINTLTLCGLVKFKSTWIMSGSSESWWRIPIQGPGWGDSTNLTLWHIDSPATLNVTDLGTPNNISHPTKVFDQDFDMDVASLNQSVRYWNGTAWDRDFTSTWVRVGAQIHTDEFYLVRWVIHNNGDNYDIRFSSTDQCEDRVSRTWVIYDNGTKVIYDADVDYSVLHILGMGYAVWGDELPDQDEIVWTETWEGVDGEDIYTYDPDWNYQAGDNDPPPEIDDDVVDTGFTWTLKVPVDSANMYFQSYSDDPLGSLSGKYRVQTYFRTEFNGDIRIYLYGPGAQHGSTYYSNGAFYLYYSGGSQGFPGYGINIWHELWLDIDTVSDKISFWLEDPTTGRMVNVLSGLPATAGGTLNGFRIFSSKQANCWMGPITVWELKDTVVEWNTELDHNITAGEYLTVMVPFLDVVTNATNVLITFGTQNDSWSTGFWVAADGPTDFGLESVQWDVAWGATEMKISMTIYNATRSIWIMDTNPEFDPDWTWELNRYTVGDHDWAPDDYYFGGVPYHSLQVTNGSWENTHPTGTYFLEGRDVHPDQIMKKRQDSDSLWVEIWLDGYEGVARVTASFSFLLTGQWDKAWDALDPTVPFPLDAPWYLGKFWFMTLDFLTGLGGHIWAGLVWIYEAGQWIVENAGWIFAGILTLITMFLIIPLWARFFKVIWGLIKFGWVLARDGVVEASEFADTFWRDFVETSYLKKVVKRLPTRGRLRG